MAGSWKLSVVEISFSLVGQSSRLTSKVTNSKHFRREISATQAMQGALHGTFSGVSYLPPTEKSEMA